MSRRSSKNLPRYADAFIEAATIAAEYIRAGKKVDIALSDNGLSPTKQQVTWAHFVGQLAQKIDKSSEKSDNMHLADAENRDGNIS